MSRALEKIERQIQNQLMQAYQLFDNRGKGFIDASNLMEAMKTLGYETDKKQVQQMIAHLDQNKTGGITKQAFKKFMTMRLDYRDDAQQIKNAYQFFDNDQREHITLADLKRVAQEFGQSTQQCQDILRECDKDQDGFIDFEQFMRAIKKTSYY